eukprot:15304080-Alexandrium_andersonii.AAC.1
MAPHETLDVAHALIHHNLPHSLGLLLDVVPQDERLRCRAGRIAQLVPVAIAHRLLPHLQR